MSNQPDQVEEKNFFERHPKKTLGVLVVLAFLAAAFIADRLLALKIKPQGPGLERYVRLRELSPLTVERFTPKPEVFDVEAGSQPRQVVIRSDEQGFIMPSRVHDQPDVVLAFLGGSTTECRAVPEENRFPYLVGRRLEEAFQVKVNSYNAARSGNNSLHSLDILLNKVMPLQPDIVVMMHNLNDLITLLYEKTYWNQNPSRRIMVEVRPTLESEVRGFFQVLREYTIPNLYLALKELSQRARGPGQDVDEFR
ncbi:MAG: SGNH/GDSL hydrolase family protein, partial [Syntrophobacterales bacterium]